MFCVFGGLLSGLLITESVVVINNTDLLGHKNEKLVHFISILYASRVYV